jgi:nucleotide-binding universal stress UspA family protein
MFKKILYPTDFSEVSKKALGNLRGLKNAGTEKVIVLRVINDQRAKTIYQGISLAGKETAFFLKDVYEKLLEEAAREVTPIESELTQAGLTVEVRIEQGVPHSKILEVAEEEGVSLIVLGSHGRSNLSGMLLGSVSDYVIRHAKKPVLVIKRD